MSVVCMGEMLIDFVATTSGVSVGSAEGFIKAAGGAPANVAVAVARLGYHASFIGQVGDDPFGHFLADTLRQEGVKLDGLHFSPQARTALAFVSLGEDGERSFSFYRHPSADMLLTPEQVAPEHITPYRIFHFGSISMISEPSRSATYKALEIAVKAGLLVSYDPNLRLPLWDSAEQAREQILEGLSYADLVKMSEEELDFLSGGDVNALWRDTLNYIVVTHGEKGATLHTRTLSHFVPSFSVQAVDTTGAGDAFVAGLLTGILAHHDYPDRIKEILRFANAVGAMTTTQKGAIPALPTQAQAQAFLATQEE